MEVDESIGLSTFNIVGLPDETIKESRDQVTVAVTNSGFDMLIALLLLGALRYFPWETLEKVCSSESILLDGAIRKVRGFLALVVKVRVLRFEKLNLPHLNFEKALECTKIHSISGLLSDSIPLIVHRPF